MAPVCRMAGDFAVPDVFQKTGRFRHRFREKPFQASIRRSQLPRSITSVIDMVWDIW